MDNWFADRGFDQGEVYADVLVPALFAGCAAQIVDRTMRGRERTVLDVGTGTGILAETAKHRHPSADVTGVDINPALLARARHRGLGPEYLEGDASELPFEDGRFDLVLSQHVLPFVPDMGTALAEMSRVCGANGRVGAAVWSGLEENPLFSALENLVADYWGAEMARRFRRPWAVPPQAIADEMTKAHLKPDEPRELRLTGRFASADDTIWVVAFSPAGPRLRELADEAAGFRADLRRALRPWSHDGAVRAPLAAWLIEGSPT